MTEAQRRIASFVDGVHYQRISRAEATAKIERLGIEMFRAGAVSARGVAFKDHTPISGDWIAFGYPALEADDD